MEMIIYLVFAVFFIVSVAIIFKKKKSGDYDERQELIRNRGYKYGFGTTALVGIALLVMKANLSRDLMVIIPLYAGALVISIYDIINGAYFRTNEKHPVVSGFLFIVVGIIEGYFGWTTIQNGEDIEVITLFMMLAMFSVLIGLAILYVTYRDKRED